MTVSCEPAYPVGDGREQSRLKRGSVVDDGSRSGGLRFGLGSGGGFLCNDGRVDEGSLGGLGGFLQGSGLGLSGSSGCLVRCDLVDVGIEGLERGRREETK